MHTPKRYLFHSMVNGTRQLASAGAGLFPKLGVGLLLVAVAQAQTIEVGPASSESCGNLLQTTTSLPQLEVDFGASSLRTTILARTSEPPSAEPRQDSPDVRIYLLWGQSHMGGSGGTLSNNPTSAMHPPWAAGKPYPTIPGCYILDKIKRDDAVQRTHKDPSSGEYQKLRDMTVGYGAGLNYPWNSGQQVDDPFVGPETSMSEYINLATGDIVVIVKMAVSGTMVRELNDDETCFNGNMLYQQPTWNFASTYVGTNPPYLRTMLEYYWDPAVDLAKQDFPGSNIYLGGIISLIGFSDARCPDAYQTDCGNIISLLRSVIGGANASKVPYLVVQSPIPAGISGQDLADMEDIRKQQADIAGGSVNIDLMDSNPIISFGLGAPGGHAFAAETIALGYEFGKWATSLTIPLIQL